MSVYEGVEIEDYVFCGPSIVFTNVYKPRGEFPQVGSEFYLKLGIKKSVSLGANCTIVCGNTIGEYAFIGAGAVVTKDIPDHALVVGNPGEIIGWVDKKGHRINFDSKGKSSCGNFILNNNSISHSKKLR